MTENMVGAICVATVFIVFIGCFVWLTNRREERDSERMYFDEITRKNKELRMNSKQFRAVLDWRMCSDPWPGGDEETVDEWLNEMARAFGFEHWIQAYHELGA